MSAPSSGPGGGLRIASPQDFAAGLFLVGIGMFFYWAGSNLNMGSLRSMGPGMLPKSLAVIIAGIGAIIAVTALKAKGPALERWNWRAIFFVTTGALLFALTIRGTDIPGPLDFPAIGLIAAGPLVAIISSFADPETKIKEVLIFAGCMTLLCAGLFKYALGLPIPLAPWLLGY